MFEAQAPAAYRPAMTLPSARSHLTVDGHDQSAHGETGVHRHAQGQVECRPRSVVLCRNVIRLLVKVGVLARRAAFSL